MSRPPGYAAPTPELPADTITGAELLALLGLARAGNLRARTDAAAALAVALEAAGGVRRAAWEALGISERSGRRLAEEPWLRETLARWPATTGGAILKARREGRT